MSAHRHRYVASVFAGWETCVNARFGCDAPQRRAPEPVPPAQQHSETSKAAAKSQKPSHLHRNRLLVFNALKLWIGGLTDEEIQAATGLGGSTERPRRIELVKERLVVDSGRVRATKSGRNAVVWELSTTP